MTDQEDNINLGKIVLDDNNLCVILFIIFGCFWRKNLWKTYDEPTV